MMFLIKGKDGSWRFGLDGKHDTGVLDAAYGLFRRESKLCKGNLAASCLGFNRHVSQYMTDDSLWFCADKARG